jgi:ferritin-like metal-binding protein YciE
MPGSGMNEKLVQFFNEALAMENAAVDRIESRVSETPIPNTKQQLQYHLEQTIQQQERLKRLITKMGGDPTATKASLPRIQSMTGDTITSTVKEAAKSIVSDESRGALDAEKELLRTKEDAIIENAEVLSYKMLMEMAEKAGFSDAIAPLKQSLQEETAMVNFIMGNAPVVLNLMWSKLEQGKTADDKEKVRAARPS